jgi:hypothetical protein
MFNAGKGRFYMTPAKGPDFNKEKVAAANRGDNTHTATPNLYPLKSGVQLTEQEFEEYKKLANG